MENIYDCIILGAGAAGMSASVYASRFKINHLIFGDKIGGQFVDAHIIENYPGFVSIEGMLLMSNFKAHVEAYGVSIRQEKVVGLAKLESENLFELTTETGEKFKSKSLLLAMGARHRTLNVPGEENYLGRGVSYCSTCDAPLFRGKKVAVVGGGNSAVTAALHTAQFASRVYLIHRRATFDKADPVWLDTLAKKDNIMSILNTQVREIFGSGGPKDSRMLKNGESETTLSDPGTVRGVVLDKSFEGSDVLPIDGVFIEIGLLPAVSLANQLGVEVDAGGSLKVNGDLSTNILGVFAAGDLVKQSDVPQLRQIITSAAQGAIGATSVYAYLNKKMPGPDWG